MGNLTKILGINLLILLIYTLVINFTASGNQKHYDILFFLAFSIAAQVVINIILCIVYFTKKNNQLGKAFLLSAGVVLVVGFSACMGSTNV